MYATFESQLTLVHSYSTSLLDIILAIFVKFFYKNCPYGYIITLIVINVYKSGYIYLLIWEIEIDMVRVMGLEPIRQFWHMPLKHACLPIPAHSHNIMMKQSSDCFIGNVTSTL